MNSDIMQCAIDNALKSPCNNKHSCIIYKNHRVVSIGINDYSSEKDGNCSNVTKHAEIKALERNNKSRTTRCNMLIISVKKCVMRDGSIKTRLCQSKPCHHCINIIKKIPYINKIYYSTADGDIECVKKHFLFNDYVSSGYLFNYGF